MPLQQCQIAGKRGWRWGKRGKCYPGASGKKRAIKQAIAIGEGGLLSNRAAVVARNPLRADPTRTATLRRVFEADIARRFARLRRKVFALIVEEDALGISRETRVPFLGNVSGDDGAVLALNTRWQFLTNPQKVLAFQRWIAVQAQADIIATTAENIDNAYWTKYVQKGYQKGAARAFDDTRKVATWTPEEGAFYQGTKDEFLRSAFGRPVAIEKVKLLAGRVFTDLKGITEEISTKMTRMLTDGLVQGQNPREIARTMIKEGIGFTKTRGVQSRALTIARTEIIRSHAEGQLDAMERLGVTDVGVMVEWSATGDDRTCPLCEGMDGVVLKIKEARGLIPRHSNCRCAHVPANLGESTKGQKRSKEEIRTAFDKSVRAEMPKGRVMKDGTRRFQDPTTGRYTLKRSKRTLAEQKRRTSWAGADKRISKVRPKSPLEPSTAPKPKPAIKPKPKMAPTKRVARKAAKPEVRKKVPRKKLAPPVDLGKIEPAIGGITKPLVPSGRKAERILKSKPKVKPTIPVTRIKPKPIERLKTPVIKPKPKPKPKAVREQVPSSAVTWFQERASYQGVSAVDKREFKKIGESVVGRMNQTTRGRADDIVIRFHSTQKSMDDFLLAEFGEEPDAIAKTAGLFDYEKKVLHSGANSLPVQMSTKANIKLARERTFAHEIGHAIDHGGKIKAEISSSQAWRKVWKEEISDGYLSNYAMVRPSEGFAEFSRAMFGPDQSLKKKVIEKCPKCFNFWKKKGLL